MVLLTVSSSINVDAAGDDELDDDAKDTLRN